MSHFDDTCDNAPTIPEDFELRKLTPGLTLCEKYRLEKEAGAGGMGVVWKAWDVVGERWVALKFIPPAIRHSEGAMAHVKTAFQTVQALNHQNIGPVYSLEKDESFGYFIVKKWLEGQTLDEIQLPPERIPEILAKVAAALDYAHSKRVMHRDVKPSNIFIGTDGDVFLIDFDLAAEIHNSISQNADPNAGRTSGTRPYMAPEQWRGQHQDGQTDQYALGVVAYQLYTGRLPFQIKDPVLLRMAVLQDQPEPLQNVPPNMNAAILRALSKDRKDRFATCREFIDALSGAAFSASPKPNPKPAPSPISGIESIIAEEKAAEEAALASKKAKAEARRREAEENLRQQLEDLDEQIRVEYQAGNYTQAAIHLQELLKLKPDDQNAQWLLQRAVQIVKKEEERKERERRARYETPPQARVMTPKKSPSVRSLKKSSARTFKKWKPKAFIGLLFLLGVTVIFSLTKSCHKDPPKPSEQDEEQKRIEHAIQLQKDTAPNGETRLVKTVDGVEFAFRWCPPGEFIMGEFPTHHDVMHNVKLTHGFWLLETEVTQAMWETVMGETIDDKARHKQYPTWPENLKGKGPDYPMYYVTWDDCQDFCEKLSEKLGQTVKLPTEAQWEYACRAGSTGDCPGTLEQIAWYGENHDTGSTHPVAQKQPNAWGFYDMIGNVWEWCRDYYDESYYTKSPPNDPENYFPSEKNVQRGGSWCREDFFCKSGARFGGKSYYLSEDFGFRVALIPDQDPPEIPDAEPASTGDGAVSQETTPQETPKAGDRKVLEAKGIQYAFRWCPPGEFIMGSPWNETKRFSDQHRVILTKGFWILETEVTQAMWKSIMDHNPSVYREDQNPVEYLDWKECQEFCQKLSEELGQKIQLPTEAQWEYACRAGSTESYAGDLDEMAWYNQNANEKPHEVGQKKPNAWGLYDMHGNVWEWCSDWYDSFYYEKSPRTDPENTTPSLNHVFRGGDYSSPADRCRSDFRQKRSPAYPYYGFGLRVALIPGQD